MDPDLAALKVAIEAASPGTPSLTCLRIADAVSVVLREAKAEAWDEGHRLHSPVLEFGETPCDCQNPYRD